MTNEEYGRIMEGEPTERFQTDWIDMDNEPEGKARLEEVLEAANKYHAANPSFICASSIQAISKNVNDNGFARMEISFFEP